MTTKIKMTWLAVVVMIVLVMGLLTAVQGSTLAGSYLPDVAGDSCSSECSVG